MTARSSRNILSVRADGLRRAADVGRIDLRAVLRPTGNPFLVARHELHLADALTPVAPEFLVLFGRDHGRSSVSVSLARSWDPRSPLAEHRIEVEVD